MASTLARIARTRQQMRRLAPILTVLAKHGFGHLVQQLTHRSSFPFNLGLRRRDGAVEELKSVSTAKRLVLVLQDLGPTFVKLGQMLSTRPDMVPDSYITELRALTDQVLPFDSKAAREIVEADLGRPIGELFQEFEDTPVASGSIGQVHHAVLPSGKEVVVKVKRPNIDRTILADLDLLDLLAQLLDRLEELKPLRPRMIAEEFRRNLRRELDFMAEAALTAKIGESLAENERVEVPSVIWGHTSRNVLAISRLKGISLNRMDDIAALKVDRGQIARDLVEVFLQQFFSTGLFHADPHPGNILIVQDGRIGLVDFGMTGRLDEELRSCLATSLIALSVRDLDIITEVFMDVGAVPEDADVGRLKADLHEVLDKYYGIPMASVDMRGAFLDLMHVARSHDVCLPRDFVLLGKSFVTMVTMAHELDPSFNLAKVAKPYALSLAADKISPKRIGHDLVAQGWHIGQALRRLPREVRSFSRKLLGGSLQFTIHTKQFEGIVQELDKATNRLAFSLIVSAIVVGSSVLLHAHVRPHVEDVVPVWLGGNFFLNNMPQTSLLGLGGFVFAGMLGLLLAVAIWRSGRL